MARVGRLNVLMGVNAAEFEAGLESARQKIAAYEESWAAAGRKMQKIGREMESVGRATSRYISLPLAAAAGAGLAAFTRIEGAQSNLIRATGATGRSLDNLKGSFRAVLRDARDSVDDVSSAMGQVNTRLGLVGEALEETTRHALAFARVNGTDVADSTATVAQLLNALNMQASEMPRVMDMLTKAAQDTDISVISLANNIREAGPAFEEFGFGLNETIALFAEFERRGARPQEVVGSLNIAMMRMARQGVTDGREAFTRLLEEVKNAPDAFAAARIAGDIFGDRVGSKVAEDIRLGAFEIHEYARQLDDATGTVERTDEASRKWTDRLVQLRNQLMVTASDLVETSGAGNLLVGVLERTITMVERLGRWLESLDPSLKTAIVGVTLFGAALGPTLFAIGGILRALPVMAAGLAKITAGAAGAAGAIRAVTLAMAVNPVLAFAIAVGAVAAQFAVLAGRAGAASRNVREATNRVKEFTQSINTMSVEALTDRMTELQAEIDDATERLVKLQYWLSSGRLEGEQFEKATQRAGVLRFMVRDLGEAYRITAARLNQAEEAAKQANLAEETKRAAEEAGRAAQAFHDLFETLSREQHAIQIRAELMPMTELDQVRAELSALETALNRVLRMEGADASNERIRELAASIQELEARRAGLEAIAATMDEMVSRLSDSDPVAQQLLRLNEITSDLEDEFERIERRSELLGDGFDAAGARAGALQHAIEDLLHIDTSDSALEDVEQQLTQLAARLQDTRVQQVLDELGQEMTVIAARAELMGPAFDAAGARAGALESAIDSLLRLGADDPEILRAIQALRERLRDAQSEAITAGRAIEMAMGSAAHRMADAFGNAVTSMFARQERMTQAQIDLHNFEMGERERSLRDSLANQQISAQEFNVRMRALAEDRLRFEKRIDDERASNFARSMQVMVRAAEDAVASILSAFARTAAISALGSLFGGPMAAKSFGQIFAGQIGVRSFAQGGIISKPTLSVVGDNPQSAEAVAPLHELEGFIAGAVRSSMASIATGGGSDRRLTRALRELLREMRAMTREFSDANRGLLDRMARYNTELVESVARNFERVGERVLREGADYIGRYLGEIVRIGRNEFRPPVKPMIIDYRPEPYPAVPPPDRGRGQGAPRPRSLFAAPAAVQPPPATHLQMPSVPMIPGSGFGVTATDVQDIFGELSRETRSLRNDIRRLAERPAQVVTTPRRVRHLVSQGAEYGEMKSAVRRRFAEP